MAETRTYVDYEGLEIAWSKIKEYYSGTVTAASQAKPYTDQLVSTEADVRKASDLDLATSIMPIDDYEINRMFMYSTVNVSTAEELMNCINNMSGDRVLAVLTADITLTGRLKIATGKEVIIDLGGHTLTPASNSRAVNIDSGSYVAIANGTIEGSCSDYLIFGFGKRSTTTSGSTIILDKVKLNNTNTTHKHILGTNGASTDLTLVMTDCEVIGEMCLYAKGSITINGGTYTSTDVPVLYVKNSTPVVINGGTYTMITSSSYYGNWGHCTTVNYTKAGGAFVVEACDPDDNPDVVINGGNFSIVNSGSSAEAFGILVILYDGNACTKFESKVNYYKASGITGHITSDCTTEPTDGWIHFSLTGTASQGKVDKVVV